MRTTMSDFDFKTLVELSDDMICVSNSTHFIFVNAAFARNLGRTKEEILATPFETFLHPDDKNATSSVIHDLEDGQSVYKFTNRYLHKDGSWRFLEWLSNPHEGLFYGSARDVTDRVLLERQRDQTLLLLEESLKVSDAGYFSIDTRSGDVSLSRELYRILDFPLERTQFTTQDMIACVHPDDVERTRNLAMQALAQGDSFSFLARMCCAQDAQDKQYKSMRFVGFPVLEYGELIGVFGLMRDMTHDEATLRQEELELFARIASHDLRAPLRQIAMFLDLMRLESNVFDKDPLKEYFEHAQRSTKRLDTLIQDLSRYVLAGQHDALVSVPVMDVLEQVLQDLNERIEAQQATIALPEHLPNVFASHSGLYHIFQNLISNALKFGQHTPELTISIHVEQQSSDHVLLSVADNGPGFAKEKEELVFQPFKQVDSRSLGGSGIGLSIVKRIVDRYHGDVWATSSPGQGCTFFIRLMLPQD